MSRKSLKKKNSEILRLKILLEDKEIAEEELGIGTRELAQILDEYSKNIDASQKKKFNKFFFGDENRGEYKENTSMIKACAIDIVASNNAVSQVHDNTGPDKAIVHAQWIKKLYRQIVQRSHPDKYIDFPIQAIKEKYTRIYMNAIEALSSNDIGLLLLCAYEVEIKVEEPSANEYIKESARRYKQRIELIADLIGYRWYHIPDINSTHFLENYLKRLGFVFDKTKANSVIKRNRIKRRKPGVRPEKRRRNIS
tara:strand:- start:541 stop:1299 length:759 start_codon:yes stop_codon:yes gene_type:complete